jgi:hypothetical protein
MTIDHRRQSNFLGMISSFVLFEFLSRNLPAFNLNGKLSIKEDIKFQDFATNEFKKEKNLTRIY